MAPGPRPVTPGWAVALAATAALAVLAASPPLIGGEVGAAVRQGFAAVCHQLPERSPHVAGGPVALCHRCSGVLLGLLTGIAVVPALADGARRRVARGAQARWLALAAVPTALDWALGAASVWPNTPGSRMITGALFGGVAGVVLGANLLTVRPHPASPTPASP